MQPLDREDAVALIELLGKSLPLGSIQVPKSLQSEMHLRLLANSFSDPSAVKIAMAWAATSASKRPLMPELVSLVEGSSVCVDGHLPFYAASWLSQYCEAAQSEACSKSA